MKISGIENYFLFFLTDNLYMKMREKTGNKKRAIFGQRLNLNMSITARYIPIRFALIMTFGLIICSCQTKQKRTDGISEGQIIYKISYPPEISAHTMSFLFPKEMNLFFKDGKQRANFKGNMGLYSLDFIHFNQSDSFYTLLQVLDKKLYVPPTKSNDIFIFRNYNNNEIEFATDEPRIIAGYSCEKATIKSSENNNLINIWFTREIRLDNPNRNTPFDKIPGVMLEFEANYNGIVLIFAADKILVSNIPEEQFCVPDDYKLSSISEIESLIQGVFSK